MLRFGGLIIEEFHFLTTEITVRDFNREEILAKMESLQQASGAFVAAPTSDYRAVWFRDQLYTAFAYYHLGRPDDFKDGVRVVFDILRRYRHKLTSLGKNPRQGDYLHAKYHPDTFDELTDDWGHHQLDAIGLFLWLIGFAARQNISVIRDNDDIQTVYALFDYLERVEYWRRPDFGMWEEGPNIHASSIGACAAGLLSVGRRVTWRNPLGLFHQGDTALFSLLPNESPTRSHDMSQLSLIWPYNIAGRHADTILERIIKGKQSLVQAHGLNRYWGDDYPYRSRNGISAEWPLGFFWLSIIFAERHDSANADIWFQKGAEQIVDGCIPELYLNGSPNIHTPLAWAHSFALIAHAKLQRLS